MSKMSEGQILLSVNCKVLGSLRGFYCPAFASGVGIQLMYKWIASAFTRGKR